MKKKPENSTQESPEKKKRGFQLWTRANKLPIERLIELRKKKLTHGEIAKIMHCTRETVTRALGRADLDSLDIFQEHEGTVWAYHRRRILSSITDKDLKKSNLLQKTIAAGTMYDKQMLKEGKNLGRDDKLTISIEHRLIAEEVTARIAAFEIQRLNEPAVVLEAVDDVVPIEIDEAFRKARAGG